MRTVNTAPSLATRNALPIYFALTFAVSWGAVLMAVGFDGLGNPADLNRPLVYVAMLLGPSVAGLLAIGLVSGRAGFQELWSRLTRWRVRAHWYAIALLAAPLLAGALLFALALISAEFLPPTFTAQGIAGAFALGLLPGLLVGLFEELGWTGFAVPAMRRRHGAVFTGVVVGLLWGAWHVVLFWERSSFADPLAFGLLVARLFAWVPAYRLLMVWVHDRTQSLPVVIVMHMSLVAVQFSLVPPLAEAASLTYVLGWAAVLWVAVAVVLVVDGRHRARSSAVPA